MEEAITSTLVYLWSMEEATQLSISNRKEVESGENRMVNDQHVQVRVSQSDSNRDVKVKGTSIVVSSSKSNSPGLAPMRHLKRKHQKRCVTLS